MGDARLGFEMVAKFNRKSVMADCVRVYWENGYNYWKNFKREYLLMMNLDTQEKVRLYYRCGCRGGVIEG